MSAAGVIGNLVESKGLSVAVLAGAAATFGMGAQWREALQFGALAALGTSLGDVALTAAGQNAKLQAYFTNATLATYVDPMDFVAGTVGGGLLNFTIGLEGRELLIASAVCGVAAGVAPKLSGYIIKMVSPAPAAAEAVVAQTQ